MKFALKNHPTLPRYYAGIRQEAARLGYGGGQSGVCDPRHAALQYGVLYSQKLREFCLHLVFLR